MAQPLLSGEVEYVEDPGPDVISQLRSEIADMQSGLSALRDEVEAMKSIFRRQYAAFQQVLGDDQVSVSVDTADKWAAIKQRLAPRLREAVDILLLQGSLRRTQLASAMKMDYSNCVKNVVAILVRQGLLVDTGGNLSLKKL